jgi:molybdopterin-guanine dinucleotide biosynthesis protein A
MIKKKRLTGIILAGGRSSRLGRNKGLALLGGRPLIGHVIATLSAVCNEILISSNSVLYNDFGYTVIPDEYPDSGPMAGIHACLKASSNEHHFVLSVDTPFVSPEFISFMMEARGDGHIAAPWFGNEHYEPLCAYYSRRVLPVIESFLDNGNSRMPDVFRVVPFTAVSIPGDAPFNHNMLFHNINTVENLRRAERYLKENP